MASLPIKSISTQAVRSQQALLTWASWRHSCPGCCSCTSRTSSALRCSSWTAICPSRPSLYGSACLHSCAGADSRIVNHLFAP